MPLYEYECDTCHHRFEVIQKFSDAPIAACPKCGAAVHKLMSSPAIQFKGSGWYITDYAKKDQVAAAKPSSSAGESAAASSESAKSGKSESAGAKPAESSPAAGTAAKKE